MKSCRMPDYLKDTVAYLGRAWCRAMHDGPMWPIHGEYACPTCLRRYPVPWETEGAEDAFEAPSAAKVAQTA